MRTPFLLVVFVFIGRNRKRKLMEEWLLSSKCEKKDYLVVSLFYKLKKIE